MIKVHTGFSNNYVQPTKLKNKKLLSEKSTDMVQRYERWKYVEQKFFIVTLLNMTAFKIYRQLLCSTTNAHNN